MLIPIAIVLFASAFWTFGIALYRPQWLDQTGQERAATAFAEGFICAVLWGVIRIILGNPPPTELMFDELLIIALWAVPSFLIRTRYKNILDKQKSKIYPFPKMDFYRYEEDKG